MNKKTFYQWLHLQKNRDDRVGDLARDVLLDNDFPKYVRSSHNKIEKYFELKNVSNNVINSFKIAWEEYE